MQVFAIYAFGVPLLDDYAPVAVYSLKSDADAALPDFGKCAAVVARTMAQVMDDLVTTRLQGLGLKLDIVPAS